MAPPEVLELFNILESNKQKDVNYVKSEFISMLQTTKEPWIVNGLVNYHIRTGSVRSIEILARAPELHAKFLFDRLEEGIKSSNWRLTALSMLGHIARKIPVWIHKIANHNILKNLLKLIKYEKDIVTLMSGLFVLITLLPMIPVGINTHLQDLFDIFSRLAAWDTTHKNNDFFSYGHREHLQLGLYGLFYNLYGMYPCNFLDFLRSEYNPRETQEIFNHTIKPMLETVRMHPLLVVCSKQQETNSSRWQKMEHHDILVECRRFSLEGSDQKPFELEESKFRSRCGTDVSSLASAISNFDSSKASTSAPNLTEAQQTQLKTTITVSHDSQVDQNSIIYISKKYESVEPGSEKWFSLVDSCDLGPTLSAPQTPLPVSSNYQDHPPRTPISNLHTIHPLDSGSPPEAAIEATPENTPIKDLKPKFQFPHNSQAVRSIRGLASTKAPSQSQPPSPMKKECSPFSKLTDFEGPELKRESIRLSKILHDRAQVENAQLNRNTGSPLKKSLGHSSSAMSSVPNSPVPIGTGAPVSDYLLAKPRPQKDGVPIDIMPKDYFSAIDGLNKEDREVTELTMRTVLRDTEVTPVETPDRLHHHDMVEWLDDDIACESHDNVCKVRNHGLHMPQSSSMLDFAKKITSRIRHYSQCLPDSASSSFPKSNLLDDKEAIPKVVKLTKVCSCPDFSSKKNHTNSTGTQTVDAWPMPYEYLITDMVQGFCDQSGKPKLAEITCGSSRQIQPSLIERLDIFIESLCKGNSPNDSRKWSEKDEIEKLREQLQLMHLHLMYERYRKEAHATRNRRLLGKCRKSRDLEEQLHALTKHVKDLEYENDDLRQQLMKQQVCIQELESKHQQNTQYFHSQLTTMENDLKIQTENVDKLNGDYQELSKKYAHENADIQHLQATVFDLSQQLQRAIKKSETVDKLQTYIRALQRELLMCSERETRITEAIHALPHSNNLYLNKLLNQYRDEVASLQETLNSNTVKLDALQSRENDLESSLTCKETIIQDLKKKIRFIKDDYGERLKAVEDKYQSLIRINQKLEGYCLELLQRVPHSPHTLSRDVTSGFSPQSSPLSTSLASSEGQAPLASHVEEIRNLQIILDTDDAGPSNISVQNSEEDPH